MRNCVQKNKGYWKTLFTMEFDDKELDKNTDNFSLDEDNSISWEDLLNTQEDDDLSDFVKNASAEEDLIVEFKTEEEKKPEIKEEIKIEVESQIDIEGEQNLDNDIQSLIDLEEEQDEIVEDIDFVQEENKIVESNDIADEQIQNNSYTMDDILSVEQGMDDVINPNINLEDEVDDELLSILNTDSSPLAFDNEDGSEKDYSTQDEYLLSEENNDASEDGSSQEDITSENEEYSYEDDTLDKQSKNKKGIFVLFVVIFIVCLLGASYCAISYFGILDNFGTSDDIPVTNKSTYGIEVPVESPKRVEVQPNKNVSEKANQNKKLDDTNKQKAEVKKEEKKVVIVPIVPSGRTNPFLPSVSINDKGFASFGSDVTLPPEVPYDTPEIIAARRLMTISVSGIMYEPNKPSAILRLDGVDYFVQKGDKIDDYFVQQITKEYVSIKNGANVYKAFVGEAFKINKTEISPIHSVGISDDGTRQYVSGGGAIIQ